MSLSKVARRAPARVGDHGNEPACDRFKARDRFDLDLRRVDVQIGAVYHLHHLPAGKEAKDRRIFQPLRALCKLFPLRSLAGEDEQEECWLLSYRLLIPNLPSVFPTVVVELGLLQTPLLLSQLALWLLPANCGY